LPNTGWKRPDNRRTAETEDKWVLLQQKDCNNDKERLFWSILSEYVTLWQKVVNISLFTTLLRMGEAVKAC
jgi:hypothetical protein